MKLRNNRYKFFYFLNAILISICGILALNSAARSSYAEDEEADIFAISGSHFVTIHDAGNSLTVKSDASTVAELLERASIKYDKYDIVEPAVESEINSDNFSINIYRARTVAITDGKTQKIVTTASYDPQVIAEAAGLSVYDGDEIDLVQDTKLFMQTGLTTLYKITHNGGQTITVEEDIPYEEISENDYSLAAGTEELIQVGELGRKVTTYQVDFIDGVEVSRTVVSEEVVKQPTSRITKVGMKRAVSIPAEWETCAGWAREAGVSDDDLNVALTLIYKESGCRFNATNAYSGAYGIPQALPGSKMASAGADWETNPVTQIRWMIGYVTGRYGGWSQAWAFWSSHHWY